MIFGSLFRLSRRRVFRAAAKAPTRPSRIYEALPRNSCTIPPLKQLKNFIDVNSKIRTAVKPPP